MGYYKHSQQNAADRTREVRLRRSRLERWYEEKPLYEALSMACAVDAPNWHFTPEVLMAISDFLPKSPSDMAGDGGSLDDSDFSSLYPALWEMCTAPFGPDGKPRDNASLLFFVEGASWKVRLSERNYRLDLWAGGSTFSEALACLEGQLHKRPVAWRKQTIPSSRK